MRQMLVHLPIRNTTELTVFEKEMTNLTQGCSLRRCMAYCDFRMAALRCYQMRNEPMPTKCILVHNHIISTEDMVATLYRHIDENEDNTCPHTHDDNIVDETPAAKRIKS
jgi:hypothetical protein